LFGCGQGQFPIRYLGIPIHYLRLTTIKWKLVEETLQNALVAEKVNWCPWEKDWYS
jgi:hypothetical protein